MSNKALWSQANHTLTIIGQQEPTDDHIKILHDGYLSAVVQRIIRGNMMSLGQFRKSIGLGILERLALDISVPALTEPFDPKVRFPVNISETATIKILSRGSNFDSWILPQTVAPRPGYDLAVYDLAVFELSENGDDEEILRDAEVADPDTDSAAINYLVSLQPKGGDGVLLNDGRANIFYQKVPVDNGSGKIELVRRAVYAIWVGRGWFFDARAVPDRWDAGHRVFLRKPLGTVSN